MTTRADGARPSPRCRPHRDWSMGTATEAPPRGSCSCPDPQRDRSAHVLRCEPCLGCGGAGTRPTMSRTIFGAATQFNRRPADRAGRMACSSVQAGRSAAALPRCRRGPGQPPAPAQADWTCRPCRVLISTRFPWTVATYPPRRRAPSCRRRVNVVTVDTMLTHLASALARPVWTLLAFAPDRCHPSP